ncbi:MAG: signal peptide peptidase SppA [Elusimicrobia bacterium]|nr:signal peptide peptidase SppA [Elusimicrobiota bacterium]
MDQQSFAPQPGPSAPASAVGGRRVKRRLMYAVAALYAVSLAAAAIVILRGPRSAAKAGPEPGAALLSLAREKDAVGWIAIHGPIYNSQSGRVFERGAEQWVRRIKAMSEAKGVKAIVLDINSPGGSVGAVQEIYSQILRVRKEKGIPFVALFDDVAASGGYYIAAACDKIVAHPGSLTGSIGVIFSVTNMQGLFGKIGFKLEAIKSGKHKDMGSPARPLTAEEKAILQDLISDAYGQFLSAVSLGRHLTLAKLKPLADGRIFSGSQAREAGLVDQLGDSDDAVALAAKLGGLSGRPRVKRETDRFSDILELLDARFDGMLSARSLADVLKPSDLPGLEYRWMGW